MNVVHFHVGIFVNNSTKYLTLGLRNSNRFDIHCLLGMLIYGYIYIYKFWKGLVQSGNQSGGWVPNRIIWTVEANTTQGCRNTLCPPVAWDGQKTTLGGGSRGQTLLARWVIHNSASCIWWFAWIYISVYISLVLIIRKKKTNQSCAMLPPYFTQLKLNSKKWGKVWKGENICHNNFFWRGNISDK